MDHARLVTHLSWLVNAGLQGTAMEALVDGLCRRLVADGLPLWRVAIGADTLHPIFEGRLVFWTRDGDIKLSEYERDPSPEKDARWRNSPFFRLYESGGAWLRRRLVPDGPSGEFPLIDELREMGATDYVAMLHRLGAEAVIGDMDCVFSSWSTDAPGGYSDADLAFLKALGPTLALVLRGHIVTDIAATLADTYLGRDAGRRVMRGHIARGVADRIGAVLWFSDLQGFTRITDTAPPETIIPLLNDYADALVSAVHGQGGQVLKFIGDGILAMFPMGEAGAADAGDACAAALAAAEDARRRCGTLNMRRGAEGLPITRFYLGLHVGEVFYGNVGSADRLDFTVVGPAVNETARIAAMCRSLDQDVLVSSAFGAASPACRARLISVGRYMLRGVGRPQELFTLDPGDHPSG